MYIINNKFSNQSITFESEISKEAKNSHWQGANVKALLKIHNIKIAAVQNLGNCKSLKNLPYFGVISSSFFYDSLKMTCKIFSKWIIFTNFSSYSSLLFV